MSKAVEFGASGVQSRIRVFDAVSFLPKTGLTVAGLPALTGYYHREGATPQSFALVDDVIGAWITGGFYEIGQGYYMLSTPDAAFAAGSRSTMVWVDDGTTLVFSIAAEHPLQKVLEAVSFTTTGGLYAADTDIFEIFGKTNVYKWANMNERATGHASYQTEIDAAILKALTLATAWVNDELRPYIYDLPFTDTNLTAAINQITAMKAGVWLYEWRGADDFDYVNGELVHRYSFMYKRIDTSMAKFKVDIKRLDVTPDYYQGPGVG
jgi:hypothetical protein